MSVDVDIRKGRKVTTGGRSREFLGRIKMRQLKAVEPEGVEEELQRVYQYRLRILRAQYRRHRPQRLGGSLRGWLQGAWIWGWIWGGR